MSFHRMKTLAVLGLSLLAAGALRAQTSYRFTLDGAQVVPGTASAAQAWAYATLDAGQTTFTLNLTHNLANAYGGAIRQAAAGSRGPALLTLGSAVSPVSQSWTVGPAFVSALGAGNLYLELYSNNYPGGEVRAQLVSATAGFPLEAAQETPPTASTAKGRCVATLNVAQTALTVNCTHNVFAPTAAHIHLGAIGVAGGVVQPLTLTATTAATSWALTPADVNNFLSGGLYVNIHSAAYPGGDLRGQMMAKWIRFPLTAAQEIPPNPPSSSGTGLAYVPPAENAITVGPVTHSVSSPTAAHIHEAPYGVAGPVIYPFASPVSPFSGSGPLSPASAVNFLAGLHYVNIHSISYPGGEIRGQMADRDDDGSMDNTDNCPGTFNPAQTDSDFDLQGDACDCAPYDNTQQSVPTAALNLLAAKNAGNVQLNWTAPTAAGAALLRYDLIRSASSSDYSAAVCVAGNLSGTTFIDGAPPAGYYLVRAKNDCGSNLGTDSNGIARTSPACTSCPAISVSPVSLAAGNPGVAYGPVSFSQSGGAAPVSWSIVSGALPAGMSFTAAGVLSGTPATPGSFPLTFKVVDVNGCSGSRILTLVINCPAITVSPAGPALAPVIYNQAMATVTFTASGGLSPYAFFVTAGALPAGLTLSSGGLLTGTPGATGSFAFTVSATDANGCSGATAYTLAVRPRAVADSYPQTVIGNVSINTAGIPYSVTGNDQVTGAATISAFDAASVQGGAVAMTTSGAGLGQFTYNPPAGYEGPDSFTYTLSDNGQTDTATLSLTVAGMVWFVNNSAASCVASGCGRLSNPFSTLAAFQALNTGAGNNPAANDNIFLYESAADYAGPVTLLGGQKLIGQDATATLATVTGLSPGSGSLPFPVMNSGGSPARIASGGNGVNLSPGASNTLRGFTIGDTAGIDLASAASFGTLTVNEVALTGTGRPLSLTSGALAANFSAIASTSSAGGQGIVITGATGAMTVSGGTSITSPSTQCILVSTTTANLDFGNTSCSGGTDGISLQNNSAGTRTFGTLNVTGGSGDAFLHSAGGGNVTVSGAATLSSAIEPVEIANAASGTAINFGGATGVTRTGATGIGVHWSGTNTGATLTFNSLTVTTTTGAGMNLSGGGTVNVTNPAGTIGAVPQAAPAIIASGIALNANFASVSASGGANGISLTNVTGTSNLGGGSLAGATGATFLVSGGAGTVTYNGALTQNSAAQRVVDIQNKTGGAVTLGGAVASAGGTGTGVILNANTGATISFQGGISLNTGANAAFTATGGGTVNVCDESPCNPAATGALVNTLTATTAAALNVANTTIGANNLEFRSISSSGGTGNGIILDTTGALGGLTVAGDGVNVAVGGNGSGGTIANKSGADNNSAQGIGIYLNNTSNVVLRRMTINGTHQNYAIRGNIVNNFTLEYATVAGTSGTAATLPAPENSGEGAVYFGNYEGSASSKNGLTGAATITNCVISGGRSRNFSVINTSGTLNRFTVTGTTFGLNQNFSDANQDLALEARIAGTVLNATVTGSTFLGSPGDQANFTGQTGTTMDVIFGGVTAVPGTAPGNVLSNSHAMNIIGGGNLTFASQGTMNFHVRGNSLRDADGSAVTFFKASAGALLSGFFDNNTIGVAATANSGSKSGNGIYVSAGGTGTMSFTITNNAIHQINGNGHIYADNTGGSYTANFDIERNTLDTPGAGWFAGIAITNGSPTSTDTINVCAKIGGATAAEKNTLNLAGGLGVIVGVSGAAAGHTFNLPTYAGGANLVNVQNFIQGNNAGTFTTNAYNDPPATPAAFTGTGTGCGTPISLTDPDAAPE
jgi:hypothetical protein